MVVLSNSSKQLEFGQKEDFAYKKFSKSLQFQEFFIRVFARSLLRWLGSLEGSVKQKFQHVKKLHIRGEIMNLKVLMLEKDSY